MKVRMSCIKDKVYSISSDGYKSIYNLKGNLLDKKLLDTSNLSSIDIGKKYIVRSNDKQAYIHDIYTDELVSILDFPNISHLKLFNDSLLAIVNKELDIANITNITIINILTDKVILKLLLHPSFTTFDFNNNILVIGYTDKIEIRGMSGEEVYEIKVPYRGKFRVEGICIYNSLILFSIDKGYVYIWNSNTKVITSIHIVDEVRVIRPYIYNGGLYICMGNKKGEVKIWNARSKKVIDYYLYEGEIEDVLLVNNRSNVISVNGSGILNIHSVK